ncbi:twin-arginine translocase TatA/TatE family subunit [Salinarimonas soli]|uniref:Sec-independent protein translocase protein TatA n=1 Tax=Salinarimonas soli TaxID=1638099 RepID=A0A5B2V9V9_9HYPH|nr:twin-arginine translocase TatA/TatE family subunit [Salinarimonas soli]KAA2235365.1 twin-arginine translocase TatA/TatE family subunit [Salinarimonas soli]
MGGASIWHWLVVGVIVMLLFGRGKVSEMMGDVAKGIKAFKKGMAEDETPTATTTHTTTVATPVTTPAEPVRTIDHQTVTTTTPVVETTPVGERKAG